MRVERIVWRFRLGGENCVLPLCVDTVTAVRLSPFRVIDGNCPLPFPCRLSEAFFFVEIAVVLEFTFDSFLS